VTADPIVIYTAGILTGMIAMRLLMKAVHGK